MKGKGVGTSNFDLSVKIKINNDTGKQFLFKVDSAYVMGSLTCVWCDRYIQN